MKCQTFVFEQTSLLKHTVSLFVSERVSSDWRVAAEIPNPFSSVPVLSDIGAERRTKYLFIFKVSIKRRVWNNRQVFLHSRKNTML